MFLQGHWVPLLSYQGDQDLHDVLDQEEGSE